MPPVLRFLLSLPSAGRAQGLRFQQAAPHPRAEDFLGSQQPSLGFHSMRGTCSLACFPGPSSLPLLLIRGKEPRFGKRQGCADSTMDRAAFHAAAYFGEHSFAFKRDPISRHCADLPATSTGQSQCILSPGTARDSLCHLLLQR